MKEEFEYDESKSRSNLLKHGIDFETVWTLWLRPVVRLQSKNRTEDRELVIGMVGEKFWTAIVVIRTNKIRIISVRRSRDEEKTIYRSYFD